ncbi:MAG: alpha-glucosidase [Oscillospiraceae bacterium]|nr:alpha-glucosidase [Oscillospiraceae bacterium]
MDISTLPWWKTAAFYQIWPRSFKDGNGDGIGDLQGVLEKLDYIKDLGCDAIWFSPLYPSPNADYGYDIADYRDIHPEYGDLELFKQVIAACRERGIKVVVDLVVNHTSDEHPWFKASLDPTSPYREYYFWREGHEDKPPNNWLSVFEGKAWELDPDTQTWYLHVFAKKQPDLNHENPKVREEVKDIMRFWLEMGVDGFREDVITYIAKREGLPNGLPLPVGTGIEHYTGLPKVKEYLKEYREGALLPYDAFTVGEAPMMTPEKALEYIDETAGSKTLDLMFHFQHMEADSLLTDWVPLPFNLIKLKRAFNAWQQKMRGKGWNALYIENHDHPRIISRYGSEKYRVESGKTLAAMYLLQSGTPFIYQGQEIGMVNTEFGSVDESKDVLTYNNWRMVQKVRLSEHNFLKIANRRSRDHARTPMQWTAEKNAGFTSGTPWFAVNKNYPEINATAALRDENSLWHWYQKLLAYRKNNPLVLFGTYLDLAPLDPHRYIYVREYANQKLLVMLAFGEKPLKMKLPEGFGNAKLLFSNYAAPETPEDTYTARPYECRVYQVG